MNAAKYSTFKREQRTDYFPDATGLLRVWVSVGREMESSFSYQPIITIPIHNENGKRPIEVEPNKHQQNAAPLQLSV